MPCCSFSTALLAFLMMWLLCLPTINSDSYRCFISPFWARLRSCFTSKGFSTRYSPCRRSLQCRKASLLRCRRHLIAKGLHHALDLPISSLDNRQIKAALIFLCILFRDAIFREQGLDTVIQHDTRFIFFMSSGVNIPLIVRLYTLGM